MLVWDNSLRLDSAAEALSGARSEPVLYRGRRIDRRDAGQSCARRRMSMRFRLQAMTAWARSTRCWTLLAPAIGRSRSMPMSCSSILTTSSWSFRCSVGIWTTSEHRRSHVFRLICMPPVRSGTPYIFRARRCSAHAVISMRRSLPRRCKPTVCPFFEIRGGLRERALSACSKACAQQSAAGRWQPGMRYLRGTGNITPVKTCQHPGRAAAFRISQRLLPNALAKRKRAQRGPIDQSLLRQLGEVRKQRAACRIGPDENLERL